MHGIRHLSTENTTDHPSLDVPTVAEHLAAQGYTTASFAGNPWVGANGGLDDGFATNLDLPKDTSRPNSAALVEAAPPFDLNAAATPQHEPLYGARRADEAGAAQALVDVYDESMPGLARSLDNLLDTLDAASHLDDTVIVLSVDHGETLDDKGDQYGATGSRCAWRTSPTRS